MSVSFSIKNVPDELASMIRARARRNHRSIQKELLAMLEEGTGHGRMTARALDIALEKDVSTCDAACLWLARTLGTEIVTLDARLTRASRHSR